LEKQEIILQIFKDIDIDNMIKKNINKSSLDDSFKDLRQDIYIILYELPYSKLYILYKRKQITQYIYGIIKNQRQSPYLNYLKYYVFKEHQIINENTPDIIEEELPNELLIKLEAINKVLYKKYPIENIENFTYIQMTEFFVIEIFKLYLKKKINSKYSFTKLSEELNINRNLISDSIQEAKKIINREYKKIK